LELKGLLTYLLTWLHLASHIYDKPYVEFNNNNCCY